MPDNPTAPARSKAGVRIAFDLMELLGKFLEGPLPQTLLIHGVSGTGKSTFLQTLIPRLKPPVIFLAYRTSTIEVAQGQATGTGTPALSLLLIDSTLAREEGSPGSGPEQSTSLAPAPSTSEEGLPRPLLDAIQRAAAQGGGTVVMDSWDVNSEREFRSRAGPNSAVVTLEASGALLRAQFGRLPVRGIIAYPTEPDPALLSAADGVIQLGWEEISGFRLRVISIPKLRQTPPPETRYLYSLEGGRFYCPPQFAPGFRPPIGSPHIDPHPGEDSLFPGSLPFADAFGRLRYHGLTGIEVPPRFPSIMADVVLYPLVAHTLSIGGRVVWIPAAPSGPQAIIAQLSRWIPPDFLRERLRVLSVGGTDSGLGELGVVSLPIRPGSGPGGESRSSDAAAAGPLFPEVYRFLKGTPEGRPSLYVIYLDGLHALMTIAGRPLTPETFPLVVASYSRLPRFHGFGFGRSDDPLEELLAAQVDTHIRMEDRYGRTVLLGTRPRSNPFVLDWGAESDQYTLVPMK